MKEYREMTSQELKALQEKLRQQYREVQARGLNLNMARGKPDADQLALSDAMWTICRCLYPHGGRGRHGLPQLWSARLEAGKPAA